MYPWRDACICRALDWPVTDATPLGYWHRFERGANIYDGADEVHKMAVARAELAKHRAVSSL